MFEPHDELSSDLEWMLESGQVDRAQVTEALVHEHAIELYQSARLYLRDPGLAYQAVEKALGTTLANIYDYRQSLGIKVWLYRYLVNQWRKMKPAQVTDADDDWKVVELQKNRLRELGVLVYFVRFNLQETSEVLGERAAITERRFKKLQLRLLLNHALVPGGSGDDRKVLDQRLRIAAQVRLLTWNDPPPDLEKLVFAVLANAERLGERRSGWLRFQEVGLVAICIALAAGLIWGGNGLLTGEDQPQTPGVTVQTRIVEITVTPRPLAAAKRGYGTAPRPAPSFDLKPTPDPMLPLSLESTSEEIRSRMEEAFNIGQSLWLDADLRLYYPQSAPGFPKEYRLQFWLDNLRARFLILSGPLGAPVQEIFLNLNGHSFKAQRSESGNYDFRDLAGGEGIQGYYLVFQSFMTHLNRYEAGDQYIPREITHLLDRAVMAVDQVNQAGGRVASFLLDINSGLALRQRYYNSDDQSPRLDVDYRNLSLNQPFPDRVFNLDFDWSGAYPLNAVLQFEPAEEQALGSLAQPVLQNPPPGLNLNDRDLIFEFEYIYPPRFKKPDFLEFRARISTDEYDLGKVEFADPWGVICDRSSDGGKLAFASTNGSTNFLYWFDLHDLVLKSHEVDGAVTQLAFSPDGQYLAYFSRHLQQGDLHILNLEQGTQRTLFRMNDVRSLVWSPDGRSLGFIGRRSTTGYDDRVMVINIESGYMFFENSVDFNPERSGEWPPLRWGVNFPVEMGDLRACAQLPQNR